MHVTAPRMERATTSAVPRIVRGLFAVLMAPRMLGAQGPAPHARDLVREFTLAFDAQRERVWRDSVVRVGRPTPAVRALLDATALRLTYRYDAADSAYRRAAADASADSTTVPYVQIGRAALLGSRGDLAGAQQLLQTASAQLERQGDSTGAAEAHAGFALLALRTSGVAAGRAALARARAWAPATDAVLAGRLACAAMQIDVRGGTRLADSTWRRIQRDARAIGARFVAECGFIYAQYLSAQGRAADAVAMFDTVAVAQTQIRAWHALSSTRQWQGSELMGRGFHLPAHRRLEEALTLAEQSGNRNAAAWALNELGRLAQRTGAPGDAAAYFRQARPLFVATGDRIGVLAADNALAQSALLNADITGADTLFRRLTSDAPGLVPTWVPEILGARAWIAGRTDRVRSTQLIDSSALVARERNMGGWITDVLYLRGLAALRDDRPREALIAVDSLLRRRPQGPRLYEALERRAEAWTALAQYDSAWQSFSDATRALENWRRTLPRREVVLASLQDRAFDWDRDLDIATMVARIAASGRPHWGLAMAEARRVRAREQEALQRGGVRLTTESGARGDAPAATRVQAMNPAELELDVARVPALAKARLSPRDAVLSYVTGTGGEPTTLFVLTRDTLVALALPPVDSLTSDIRTFGALLASGGESSRLATALAQAVLTPALRLLPADLARLIIVPDGELHRLPFSALEPTPGQPLIARVAIAQALSVDDALGGVRRASRASLGRSVALGAPDHMPRIADVSWLPLPGARREVRDIADLIQDVDVVRGAAATRAGFTTAVARGGRILHIATHAVADPASFTRSAMALQPTATDDGVLRLADLQQRPLAFDLVVLSACASSEGVLLAGQGVHGFVGAMLDAGAGGVVATRWAVGDSAVVPWMHRFYRELLVDGDPVRALRTTQQAARASGAPPAVWANLQYVGDPTVRVTLAPRSPSLWARLTTRLRRWFGDD